MLVHLFGVAVAFDFPLDSNLPNFISALSNVQTG